MLKQSIIFNSFSAFLVVFINFAFKTYLTRQFLPNDLVILYVVTEILSLISRFYDGYKDVLITRYNINSNSDEKKRFLKYFFIFFAFFIVLLALIAIPLINKFYIEIKIENFELHWIYISVLFVFIGFNSFFSNVLLIRKFYFSISIIEISKTILFVIIVFTVSMNVDDLNYVFLIQTNILIEILLFLYAIFINIKKANASDLKYFLTIKKISIKFGAVFDILKTIFLASVQYFVYGLILFAPMFFMLDEGDMDILANYQVIAKSIYFALVTTFSWPLARFLFPHIASIFNSANIGDIAVIRNKLIKLLILFNILTISLCFLLSEIFISFFFPKQYIKAYEIVNIMVLSLPFVMYSNFSVSIIKASGDYRTNLFVSAFGLFMYALSYKLFRLFEIQYSAIFSFDISMISMFFIALYYEIKIIKEKK